MKQAVILRFLFSVEKATINEISENTGIRYWNNTNKHLGAILSRMVKKGLINRVKKGIFSVVEQPITIKSKPILENPNQLKLFL